MDPNIPNRKLMDSSQTDNSNLMSSFNALMSGHLSNKEQALRIECEKELASLKEQLQRKADECSETKKKLEATREETSEIYVQLETCLKTSTDERKTGEEVIAKFKLELEQKTVEAAKVETAAKALRSELNICKLRQEEELNSLAKELSDLKVESARKQISLGDANKQQEDIEKELHEMSKLCSDKENVIEQLNARILTAESRMMEAVMYDKQPELEQERKKAIGLADQLESVTKKIAGWKQSWQTSKEIMNANYDISHPDQSTSTIGSPGLGYSMVGCSVGAGSTDHQRSAVRLDDDDGVFWDDIEEDNTAAAAEEDGNNDTPNGGSDKTTDNSACGVPLANQSPCTRQQMKRTGKNGDFPADISNLGTPQSTLNSKCERPGAVTRQHTKKPAMKSAARKKASVGRRATIRGIFCSVITPRKRLFKCDVCHKELRSTCALREHKDRHHESKRQRSYLCEICPKAYFTSQHLTRHRFAHTAERPFKCNICKKTFKYKHCWKDHMTTHDPLRKRSFQCSICPKSFHFGGDLKRHEAIHTEEKAYSCSICSKCFKTGREVKLHMVVHSDLWPFQCQHCSKKFKRRSGLCLHKRVHEGDRPTNSVAIAETIPSGKSATETEPSGTPM